MSWALPGVRPNRTGRPLASTTAWPHAGVRGATCRKWQVRACLLYPSSSDIDQFRRHSPDFDTGDSMFASRASTHLPFCFLRMERVCPARVIGGAPRAE